MVLKGIQPILFSIKKRCTKKSPQKFPKNSEENSAMKNCSQYRSNVPENSKVLGKEVPIREADPAIIRHDLI